MDTSTDLTTPVLLLAMPQVQDPFFNRSVVLLLEHTEEGSFGFIVNRSTGITVAEILSGLEIDWGGKEDEPAFFGGPVQPQVGSVLFEATSKSILLEEGTVTELLPRLLLTQHLGSLTDLAEKPPEFFRLVLGHAGWGEGQLVEEILRDDWLLAPVTDELLFGTPPAEMWQAAVRSVGVDPATLPAWTQEGGSESTN